MINPLLAIDFYKADHRSQYPYHTKVVYSNFTPRSNRLYKGKSDSIVVFGIQMFIKDYLNSWNDGFFNKPKAEVVAEYQLFMDSTLGAGAITTEHIAALHDIGYLPIVIKALPEGSLCPMKVPVATITNTLPEFFWLPNYLETVMSAELWKPMTNATIAYEYRKTFEKYAELTGANKDLIIFQGHDFSSRGLSNREDMYKTQISHLTSFVGTDTCLAIQGARDFYNADYTKELVGTSVPATEHSVMCSNITNIKHSLDVTGKWVTPNNKILSIDMLQYDTTHTNTQRLAEIAYIWYLITEVYPTGIVSIVADTFDFWYMMEYGIEVLKPIIESRKPNSLGLCKVVFRPDSGNPVDIICGIPYSPSSDIIYPYYKGAIECLWDVFGGTINDKGYKTLSPYVGLIYGDSITLERQDTILRKLADKKFASDNIVLGLGSYTYQYSTRDTFGFAMKATNVTVGDHSFPIYKDPATDAGTKKSAKGLLMVTQQDNSYVLVDNCTPEQEQSGCLQEVYRNGDLLIETTLQEIRNRLNT